MTEDVVREALVGLTSFSMENAEEFGDKEWFKQLLEDKGADIIDFLNHILEAGPDERMYQDNIGTRPTNGVRAVDYDRLLWYQEEQGFLNHLISRLEENTND